MGSAVCACLLACMAGQADLDSLTRVVPGAAQRASSNNPDIARNGDARPIEIGGALPLLDADGPGVVVGIWTTMNGDDPFIDRSVSLRIYYDGSAVPSVNAPIGDFFGVGNAARADLESAPVHVSAAGRSKACYWKMPFRQHIRIEASNDSAEHRVDSFYYYVDWRKLDALPDDTVYFCAQYRQAFPAQPGRYTVADIAGRGHYVGTVYSAYQMELGWFGEGDDFFFLDGAADPQLRGTGTEDYFRDAWGFRPHSGLYSGVPVYEGVFAGDRVTAYRWHIPDPIPFERALRFEMEHRGSIFNPKGTLTNFELGTFEERPDWISSVAFWYQTPPAALEADLPPASQRVAPFRMLVPATLTHRADPVVLVLPSADGVAYVPNTPKASIEFDFEIKDRGTYRIDGRFMHAIMGGIYQPLLDGEKIGPPLDFVIANADPYWVRLDTHELEPGVHTLRFEGVDAVSPNARAGAPKLYAFGLERLLLLRLEDMEGHTAVSRRILQR